MNNNELYHYGVLGMKWGKRKARPTTNASKVAAKKATYDDLKKQYLSAKADKRAATKEWSKTYNQATKLRNSFGEKKQMYEKKVEEAGEAANRAYDNHKSAKSAYKQAKKDYKAEINKTNENYKKNFAEKYVFNAATSKRINKYLNSGATLKEARTKTYISAGVNTAAVLLAAYGSSRLGEVLVNKFV